MKERIGTCKWRVLAGVLAVGGFAISVSAANRDATRDKGRTTPTANRLVAGPSNHLNAGLNDGGIAADALIEGRWLAPQGNAGGGAYPAGTVGVGTNSLTLPGARNVTSAGEPLWVGLYFSNWGPQSAFGMKGMQAAVTEGAWTGGLVPFRPACGAPSDCTTGLGVGEGSTCTAGFCEAAFVDTANADFHGLGVRACNSSLVCGCNITGAPLADPGTRRYFGTVVAAAPTATVGGPHTVTIEAPGANTFLTLALNADGSEEAPAALKVVSPTVTIPSGSCCFGIGTPADGCVDDVSALNCAGRPAATNFRLDTTCAEAACAECGLPTLPACADPVAGVTADNRCTTNTCNLGTLLCEYTPIPGWNLANQCCAPGSGALAPRFDDDDCTDDLCTRDGTSFGKPVVIGPPSGLGVPSHPVSAAGGSCDDGNDCTYRDLCDGVDSAANGGCSGVDINGEACASDADCDGFIPGVTCDLTTGFCFCTLSPNIIVVFDDGPFDKDGNCHPGGGTVTGVAHVGPAVNPVNGYQLLITYDPSCLDLVSVSPLAPWTQVLIEDINEAAGTIFYAAGVEFGAGDGPFGDADLLELTFNKIPGCGSCDVCIESNNPRNSYLTDHEGQPITLTPKCSKPIRGAGDLTLDIPDSTKVNVGCDSVRQTVTWDPASASDTCGVQDFFCLGEHQSGKDVSDRVLTGGEFPRGDATFCCWAQNDCGTTAGFRPGMDFALTDRIAEGCWTVSVNDQTTLDIEIELSPTMESKPEEGLNRCIKFEGFGNCVQGPTVFERDLTFGGIWNLTAHSVDEIKVPSGQFACLTARDQHHTLRACALRSDGNLACVDGVLYATFKGDPFFGGNWLIGGNLDGWKKDNPNASHDVIDILDFGQFVAQYLNEYDSDGDGEPDGDLPCDSPLRAGSHADINGDGIVDLLDFSFISLNFLESSKDCCCPGSVGNTNALTEISVNDLRKLGLKDLAIADVNGDGLVNLEDMSAFMAGETPVRKPLHGGLRGTGRK